MSQFKTIVEVVLRNSGRSELNRVQVEDNTALAIAELARYGLEVGDSITIEARETEVE